jgi:hypothetical protein
VIFCASNSLLNIFYYYYYFFITIMNCLVKSPGPSGKPVVTITASAAASVTAAAKAAMSNALKDNEQINDAVSKVLGGYDWTLVPVPAK